MAIRFASARKLSVTISMLLVCTLVLSVSAAFAGKKDKKPATAQPQPEQKIDTSRLVWPAPPDIARIRYISEVRGEKIDPGALKQKKKQGWMDRLAGLDAQGNATEKKFHLLLKPYGIAIDSKGLVYVADTYVGAVFIFNVETGDLQQIRNGAEARFKNILGLALDDNDRLFVTDAGLQQVSVFDANHKFEANFGAGILVRPCGIAVDAENRFVYVVDTAKEQVFVFDADSFKLLRTIGRGGKDGEDEPGTFAKPTNVAIDADGSLYVSDTLNDRVQIFDADGHFISMFGKAGDGPGHFARPKGIAVDADGHIWVIDAMQNRLQIFDKKGHLLAFLGEFGTLPGQFGLPTGLAIDKSNRVVVSEQLKGRIQVFRYVTESEAKVEREKRGANATTASAEAKAAKP